MTPREEYEAALAQYYVAQARLTEARKHYDPKIAPEAIEQRRVRQAEYRAKRRVERDTPEAKAECARRKQEYEQWMQRMANISQATIEQSENMPNALRIITRVGDR